LYGGKGVVEIKMVSVENKIKKWYSCSSSSILNNMSMSMALVPYSLSLWNNILAKLKLIAIN
jgi:hypothetical protein